MIPETFRDAGIARAMESIAAAIPRAEGDPSRPRFHFRPPAQWMNDPNGPIHHAGLYHVFYQHNPFGDAWDHMHWGHARSRDLVHWEHLPVALRPSVERGERHCFSGCCHLDGSGKPVILYTSVPYPESGRPHEQWAATGSSDLLVWEKSADNPVLDLATHGGPVFRGDWRDPYVFGHAGRTFLVLAAVPEAASGAPGIYLYEALRPNLTGWTYRGMLFEPAGGGTTFLECPNFFPLAGKWVLLASPFGPVARWIGSFDLDAYRFVPDSGASHGMVDRSPDFYASNVFFDDRHRCILLAWVRGFPPDRGWNGCLALPRLVRLERGGLLQEPLPELAALRGEQVELAPFDLRDAGGQGTRAVGGPAFAAEQLELDVELCPAGSAEAGLRLLPAGPGTAPVTVRLTAGSLDVAGIAVPKVVQPGRRAVSLRVFYDRSVLEVFVNGGVECVTRVVSLELPVRAEIYVRGGSMRVAMAQAWRMRSISLTRVATVSTLQT